MTEPLIVDPSRLASASETLVAAAGNIPVMPPPLSVPGTDPLSMAVAQGAVAVEAPMAALPEIKTAATTTATNVGIAAQRYTATDAALAERAAAHRFEPAGTSTPGGAPGSAAPAAGAATAGVATAGSAPAPGAAAKAGGLSQMMGTPLQMAQQAGQIPAQLASTAGQGPQGVMQAAQGAVQQVTQMASQVGKGTGDDRPAEAARESGESSPEDTSAEANPA